MIAMTISPRRLATHKNRPPPGDLPKTPDDIDLDRVVTDPDYRRAVQELLRRWGVCEKAPRKPR
jgi:hypothetical protein